MSLVRLRKALTAALLAAIVTAIAVGAALAKDPDEEARAIASSLQCPVCAGQSVEESPSQLAVSMRTLIRKKVEQDESREEILKYFVDRYGESILREPPKEGFNQVLWWIPAVGIIAGLGGLGYAAYRWQAGRRKATPSASSRISKADLAAYGERLEQELRGEGPGRAERAAGAKGAERGSSVPAAQASGPRPGQTKGQQPRGKPKPGANDARPKAKGNG